VTRRETSSEIDKAAAAWTACADRGPLSDAERRALDAWLDGDPRRRGAFARANAVMVRADLAWPFQPGHRLCAARLTDRRRLLIGGGLAAAFGGVAFVGVRAWSAPLDLQSSKGEVRRVPLPDGSNVTLNTQSLVKVRYTRHSRAVSLASGEALFNVAEDGRAALRRAGRRGSAAGPQRQLHGSARRSGPVRVLVQTGHVRMTCGEIQPLVLAANAAVLAPAAPGGEPAGRVTPVRLDADEVARRLAWQDGLLAFNGESLAQAAGEFARYSSTRIVIDDPALADEPLTGLYASSDPEGFARGAALSLGARDRGRRRRVRIVR
jgi:transmembrane sensor